ncbi:hypothetical protein HDV06_004774 [Boothiomyces sp. JEL0866]|nr:hypothetical protein HDV06_004774 [Boothiomyces sp. JEL0866]
MLFSKKEKAEIDEPQIALHEFSIPNDVMEFKVDCKLEQFVKVEISIEDVEECKAVYSIHSKREKRGKDGIYFLIHYEQDQCSISLEGKKNFCAAAFLKLIIPQSMLVAFTGNLINGQVLVVGNGQYMNSVKVFGQNVKVAIKELLADSAICMVGNGKTDITDSIIKKIDLTGNEGAKIINADTNKLKILSIGGVSVCNLLAKDSLSIVTVSGKVKADVCFPNTCKGMAVIKTVSGKITGTFADYYKVNLETVNAGIDVQLKPLDRKTVTKLDSVSGSIKAVMYGFEGGYQVHTRHHDAEIDNGENVDLVQEMSNVEIYKPKSNIYVSDNGDQDEVVDEKPNGPPTVDKIDFNTEESMLIAEGSKTQANSSTHSMSLSTSTFATTDYSTATDFQTSTAIPSQTVIPNCPSFPDYSSSPLSTTFNGNLVCSQDILGNTYVAEWDNTNYVLFSCASQGLYCDPNLLVCNWDYNVCSASPTTQIAPTQTAPPPQTTCPSYPDLSSVTSNVYGDIYCSEDSTGDTFVALWNFNSYALFSCASQGLVCNLNTFNCDWPSNVCTGSPTANTTTTDNTTTGTTDFPATSASTTDPSTATA